MTLMAWIAKIALIDVMAEMSRMLDIAEVA